MYYPIIRQCVQALKNLGKRQLVSPDQHAAKIKAVRNAAQKLGIRLFINARTDPFLLKFGSPDECLNEAAKRAKAYADAGADGIFVPGLTDLALIEKFAQLTPLPVNIMVTQGVPEIPDLARAGVRRLSLGPWPMMAAIELGAAELYVEMFRPVLVGRDERQIDVGLVGARKLDLRLLGRILEALQGEAVLAQIDALLLAEFVRQKIHDPFVEILATEEGVAICRFDFEDTFSDLENRNIEGTSTEVVNGDLAGSSLVETIGKRGGRRLIDDAKDFEPGDAAGVLGRLALGVIEISGRL